jgi:toxin ParE1/3/4
MPDAKVVFHRLAQHEYDRISTSYARQGEGLDARFEAELDRAVARIAADPICGAVFRERVRWLHLRRFSYVLYYFVIDPSLVLVLAVAHARRRTGYWIGRLKLP